MRNAIRAARRKHGFRMLVEGAPAVEPMAAGAVCLHAKASRQYFVRKKPLKFRIARQAYASIAVGKAA
jgi:hypothetical protein